MRDLFQKQNQVLILCLLDIFPFKPMAAALRREGWGNCHGPALSRLGGVAQHAGFQLEVNTRRQGLQSALCRERSARASGL